MQQDPNSPQATTGKAEAQQFNLDPVRPYILVLPGEAVAAVRVALDAVGRNLGADNGRHFWELRGLVGNQAVQADLVEAEAKGIIDSRSDLRNAEKMKALNEEAAKTVADRVSRKKK